MFVRQFLQGFVQFFMQFVKKCILDGRKFRGRKLLEIFVGSVFLRDLLETKELPCFLPLKEAQGHVHADSVKPCEKGRLSLEFL